MHLPLHWLLDVHHHHVGMNMSIEVTMYIICLTMPGMMAGNVKCMLAPSLAC